MLEGEHVSHILPDPKYNEKAPIYCYKSFPLTSFAVKYFLAGGENFEARPDDIYVVSYPKCGTTWAQELVYVINTLDFEKAKKVRLEERFPYMEMLPYGSPLIANMDSPRYLKSHYPYQLLPQDIKTKKCKIVYIARNPKDTCVSFYHFARLLKDTAYEGTFEQFCERFLLDRCTYSPFWKHVIGFWDQRNSGHILYLKYEDLVEDLPKGIATIAAFLGKTLTEADAARVAEHCTFKEMSQNPAVNRAKMVDEGEALKDKGTFFRKGKVGNWKEYFSGEMNAKMDEWIKMNSEGTGLEFTYA